jgi:exodeoxyribonuclease VII large subunit
MPIQKMSKSVISVSQLTESIKTTLETGFPSVMVEGEVSQPTFARSGHVYFTLKDDTAQLACVIWRSTAERLKLRLEHGQLLTVGGGIQVYPPTGRYQLIVNKVQLAGEGALQMAFLALKQKLEAEGLFDAGRKRPLPRFPRTIGVVTSATGAAFQDIRDTLERRWPVASIQLYHASVQGVSATGEIVAGIRHFSQHPIDVLIVGRGGGSLEDLWCFNEEAVARAIAACPAPVISAVGHETDFSISDFVADVRAATPTQAAMMVAPDQNEIRMRVDDLWSTAYRTSVQRVDRMSDRVARLRERTGKRALVEGLNRRIERIQSLLQRGHNRLTSRTLRIGDRIPTLRQRSEHAVMRSMGIRQHRLDLLAGKLESLNPDRPLELGFTRVMQGGKWIRRIDQLQLDEVNVVWKEGNRTFKP